MASVDPNLDAKIAEVEEEIKKVSVSFNKAVESGNHSLIEIYAKEKEQLRRKEEQLRKKEEQLREGKLQAQFSGGKKLEVKLDNLAVTLTNVVSELPRAVAELVSNGSPKARSGMSQQEGDITYEATARTDAPTFLLNFGITAIGGREVMWDVGNDRFQADFLAHCIVSPTARPPDLEGLRTTVFGPAGVFTPPPIGGALRRLSQPGMNATPEVGRYYALVEVTRSQRENKWKNKLPTQIERQLHIILERSRTVDANKHLEIVDLVAVVVLVCPFPADDENHKLFSLTDLTLCREMIDAGRVVLWRMPDANAKGNHTAAPAQVDPVSPPTLPPEVPPPPPSGASTSN